MRIAGFQKLSLVDFPGKICSIVFTQGCNFRCGYCQNPSLAVSESSISETSEKEVLEYLSGNKKMIEGLVITGGEPVMCEDLSLFIEKVREIGLKVKLDTNGSDPGLVKTLLSERKIEYIALDIKTSFQKYHLVTGMKDISERVSLSIEAILSATIPYELRTTCVPGIVEAEDLRLIGEKVKGAQKYCLQQFRPEITLDEKLHEVKPYTPETLQSFADILSGYVEKVEIRGV